MTFESLWRSYATLIPADAPAVQLQETRRAFYAGAVAFRRAMNELFDDDASLDATPQEVTRFEVLNLEIEIFLAQVRAGKA